MSAVAGDEIETNADAGYYEEAFVEPGVPRREYEALIEAFESTRAADWPSCRAI